MVDGEWVRAVLRRGAFDAWFASGRTAPAVLDHDSSRPVGGSLTFSTDAFGLRFVLHDYEPPPEITGVSLEFASERWTDLLPGVREFREADVRHLAILTPPNTPAFPGLAYHLELTNDH
jgi:hypothetical protein